MKNKDKRIVEFDAVIRAICTELGLTYAGVDVDEGEIIDSIKNLKTKIARAYGYLWHVNNNPDAPIPLYSTEKAGYEARKILRDTMTHEQRGKAISKVRKLLTA